MVLVTIFWPYSIFPSGFNTYDTITQQPGGQHIAVLEPGSSQHKTRIIESLDNYRIDTVNSDNCNCSITYKTSSTINIGLIILAIKYNKI